MWTAEGSTGTVNYLLARRRRFVIEYRYRGGDLVGRRVGRGARHCPLEGCEAGPLVLWTRLAGYPHLVDSHLPDGSMAVPLGVPPAAPQGENPSASIGPHFGLAGPASPSGPQHPARVSQWGGRPTEGVTSRVAGGFPEAAQSLVGYVSPALPRLKRGGGD